MTNYKIGNNIGNTNNIRKGDLPDDFKIRHKNFTAIATWAHTLYLHDPRESQTCMDSRADWG